MAENVIGPDPTIQQFDDGSSIQQFDDGSSIITDNEGKVTGVPPGAEPASPTARSVNITSIRGVTKTQDQRVKIKVPDFYLKKLTTGLYGELGRIQGIIFPYTPQISYDVRAEYTPAPTVHSNYTMNFFQRSSIGTITITGKFTVQNEKDAGVYLATMNLLKALTKMRAGDDTLAGSPPPVCRLNAYGPYMFNNVPIAITSYRIEMPDTVDYFTLGKQQENPVYGVNAVPTLSTMAVNCIPMYSRNEMQSFTVKDWLTQVKDTKFRNTGYL